jgi:hypothetical protein
MFTKYTALLSKLLISKPKLLQVADLQANTHTHQHKQCANNILIMKSHICSLLVGSATVVEAEVLALVVCPVVCTRSSCRAQLKTA